MRLCALATALIFTVACGGKSTQRPGDSEVGDAGAGNGPTSNGGSSGSSNGGSISTTGGSGAASSVIYLFDQNNYRTQNSLSIPTIETASGVDLDICWTDVLSDLECDRVDPLEAVDNVSLLRFRGLSEDEIQERMASGELSEANLNGYLQYDTDHQSTCMKLSSFSVFGSEVDVTEEYVASEDRKYLFVLTSSTISLNGAFSMVFGKPVTTSTNTAIDVPPGCGIRAFSASLTTVAAVPVPPDGPWILDWSNLSRDGAGNAIRPGNIDGLRLWFVAGSTSTELEPQIANLDDIATTRFGMGLTGGRTADLSTARNLSTDEAFPGFHDDQGTWLLALTCGSCLDPAPVALFVLVPWP